MEIYMIRHGETIWNKESRYYGFSDVPLSEQGVIQAKELGHFFKNIAFDKVIVSPLTRAMDTARYVTEENLIPDERLKEQNFGLFEGKTYRQLKDEYPEELKQWNKDHENYCLPMGESFTMVRNRIDSFLTDLKKEEGKKILIVAHKGTLGHLLAAMCQMPLSGYWNFVFEQGTYSKVDLEDGFAILRTINRIPVI